MMFKKLRNKIKDNKYSKNLFWKFLVFGRNLVRGVIFFYKYKRIPSNGFNEDIYIKKEIKSLIKKFGIKIIVETGTCTGVSTKEMADIVDSVYSIEINKKYYNLASKNLKKCKNVTLLLGNSPKVLKQILPKLKKPILFYLDAHWYKYWPILHELNIISKFNHCKDSVIVIHDFYVPNRNFGFDIYNNQRLDYKYIKKKILSINPKYKHYYNSKAIGEKRGVIYIYPPIKNN